VILNDLAVEEASLELKRSDFEDLPVESLSIWNLGVDLFECLHWFWELANLEQPEDLAGEYRAMRAKFMHLLPILLVEHRKLPPCFHYLTNHAFQDYLRWGPLYYLQCESGEASHVRDKRRAGPSGRGASSNASFTKNTWETLLNNHYAFANLIWQGKAELFVFAYQIDNFSFFKH
jgi:hypothetical protein